MKNLRSFLLVTALLTALPGRSAGQDDARALVDWLHVLSIEARLSYQFEPNPSPRLLSQTVPDGRSLIEFIADSLGTAAGGDPAMPAAPDDWALLDEAVSICLAEAERIKALAAEIPGTPEEATLNEGRRKFLKAAGRLLRYYKIAGGDAFDANAGGLLGLPALPDWIFPGEIQLRKIGGAGRLNTETHEFAGRFSGELVLPMFGTSLLVPNLSFDSRGNVDLTAYGQTTFPPNDPNGVTLTIPPRNPLIIHLADDGDFRVAGAATLELPDGNSFQAYFDVDDPDYSFGLAFSGSVTFELAREMVLLRPTITLDPANPPSLEVIDGMAQFFGSLGKGMETFIGESPVLPSLDEFDVGSPPEFKTPESAIPFDVFDAWIVGIGNEHVRPALNGPVDGTVGSLRESLAGLRTHLEAVSQETGVGLTQLQRLSRVVEMNGKIQKMLEDSAARAALGQEGETVFQEASALADEALRAATDYLTAVPPDADFKTGLAAARLAIRADRNAATLGFADVGLDFAVVTGKIDQWNASMLAREGFNADGTVADPARVAALTPVDLRTLAMATLEIDRFKHILSTENLPFAPVTAELLRLEFEKVRDAYNAAVADGDDEARIRYAAKLPEFGPLAAGGVFSATDQERDLTLHAFLDTWNALSEQDGGSPRNVLATQKLLQKAQERADTEQASATRRKEELFGAAGQEPDLADRLDFSLYEYSFWQRIGFGIRALRDASILDAALEGRLKADLATIFDFYRQALEAKYADATLVQQNLEDAYGSLVSLLDMIILIEDFLPEDSPLPGEFRQTWEALHVQWVVVAEARQAHWLLSAYAQELADAANRYGNGVGPALELAFASAGTEATAGLVRVVDGLNTVFDAIGSEEVRFMLPGDLEVRRLFGDLAFNRITGDWGIGFGGLLVFPDINAEFEIVSASLASNGDLAMSLRTSGPAPFGLADSMSLDVRTAFALTGNVLTPSIDSAMASGTLTQAVEGQAPNIYDVTLAYEFLDPGHRMRVETSFQDQRPLFTNEIVLFSGGFGFELVTDGGGVPQQGGLETDFSAGILLRPEARAKPVDQLSLDDFFLSFAGSGAVEFSRTEQQVSLSLNSGTLTLPPDIFSDGAGAAPATISLTGTVCITISLATGEVSFCDVNGVPVRLIFANIQAKIPGLDGATLGIPNATLLLSAGDLPVLENLRATLTLPLPGSDASDPAQDRFVSVEVSGTNWRLDGLPDAASVNLGTDLHLVDLDNFDLFLLAGTGFSLEKVQVGNDERTEFSITGSIRGEMDESLLAEESPPGGNFQFGGGASGTFTWDFVDPPQFTLSALRFSGNMKLGGANGLVLTGVDANGFPKPGTDPSIELLGLEHLFSLSETTPFEIKVNGAIGAADALYFGLKDARVVFDGIFETPPSQNTEPQFFVSAIGFREGDDAVELLGLDALPARLTAGSVSFINPTADFPDRLALSNLVFVVSGEVDLSLGEGEDVPRLFGAVEDLKLGFPEGFGGPPTFGLDSLALTLENLNIGDMAGLTGGLVVGNLNDPDNLFFGGVVGGGFNGVGIEALLATRLDGLIGVCLKVNAGPVGIPLDGGTLGGIMLSGASGGVYFGNTYANPCSFSDILGLDPETGRPPANSPADLLDGRLPAPRAARMLSPEIADLDVLTWKNLAAYNEQHSFWKEWRDYLVEHDALEPQPFGEPARGPVPEEDPEPPEIPCPSGNCPPATISLLSQRHPSAGEESAPSNYNGEYANRIIYKFTSLDREMVDEILAIAGIDLEGATPENVGIDFAQAVHDVINDLLPRPSPPVPNAAEMNQAIDEALSAIQTGLATAVTEGLNAVTGGESLLDALYKVAYGGVPSLDVTILLNGTFTWTPVSAALSATGGAVVSTTGSAGILGSLNLVGLPVGIAEFYFSMSDANGLPNPSFCGFARASLGPLDLGRMDMAYDCPGCITGVLDAMLNFVTTLSGDLAASADPILRQFIADALGVEVGLIIDPLPGYFGPGGSLTQPQQVAVMACLINLPELVRFRRAHPELGAQFSVEAMSDLSGASIDLLLDIYDALDPSFTFCGEVSPELFGIPLMGGASLVAAQMHADKRGLQANLSFSPSYVFGNLPFTLASGGYVTVVPALDEAAMGFAVGVPEFDRASFDLMTSQPFVYADQQLNSMLSSAQLTFGYELKPFGFKLADGEGRVILPTITHHPDNPSRPDGQFSPPAVPSRDQVLKAALDQNLLALAPWEGKGEDLPNLFPDPSAERNGAIGKELGRHYFPHGGFLGAAKLQLPRPITDFLPVANLNTIVSESSDLGERFTAAQAILDDYLLASNEVGQMTMYVPFPAPPAAFWTGSQRPRDFIDQVASLDLAALIGDPGNLYPVDQIFMRGEMQLDILGMPLAEGHLVADPALGLFEFSSSVPEASWLHKFVQGDVTVQIRNAEYIAASDPNQLPPGETVASMQPEARLQAAFEAINAATTDPERLAAIDTLIDRVSDTLPKASMEASLGVNLEDAFATAGLADFIAFNSGVGFYAYSPRFEPAYATPGYTGEILFPDPDPDDPGPYTLARRNGGIVMGGDFNFGFNLTDATPANRLQIEIPEMAIALTGGSDNSFPNLAARAIVQDVSIPNLPSFREALFAFNTNPGSGESLLRLDGTLEPFGFRLPGQAADFLTLRGLNGGDLEGTLRVTDTSASLAMRPAQAILPFLGPGVALSVFGNPPPPPGSPALDPGDYEDFSFSSTPGEEWQATVCLSHSTNPALSPVFGICDPFNPGSACSVTFEPDGPVYGTIRGTGLDRFELQVQIPNGFDITFFPEQRTKTTVENIGGGSGFATLYIDSTGRFYVDFGQQNNVGLPGILTASGHLEFGYNPEGSGPVVTSNLPGTYNFDPTDLNGTTTHTFTISNTTGDAPADVVLGIEDSADFSVNSSGFRLPAGQSRNVDLIFHPTTNGPRTGTLVITSNDEATPRLSITLGGTGISVPRYFQSRDRIGLGTTVVGDVSRSSMTIGNAGSAPLHVTSLSVVGDGFSIDPSSGFTLQPGGERLLVVEFAPPSLDTFSGNIFINGSDFPAKIIPLTGSGGSSRWLTILDSDTTGSSATLRDIRILDGGVGYAVGDEGTIYETRNGGHSWSPRGLTSYDLKNVHVESNTVADPFAVYHFEEPNGSLHYRDDGRNGIHGSTPSTGNRPRGGYSYGKVGAGLYFNNPSGSADNSNSDYVELGTFDLEKSFAISLWVNPVRTHDGQFFVGKHTDSGSNQFLFGFYTGGYWVATPMGSLTAGSKQTGWQHLVVNATHEAGANTTTIELYRNGASLGSTTMSGGMGSFGGGNPWVLGQEWDNENVSDVFEGSMDELMFFDRALKDDEITALAKGSTGQRILLAGENGTALQSETLGRSWHQVFDQTANGFVRHQSTFRDYDYNGATTTPGGKVILAGSMDRNLLSERSPMVMFEEGYDPDPKLSGDERYGAVLVDAGSLTGAGEFLTDVATCLNGRSYAVSNRAKLYHDNNGTASTWPRHGSLNLPGSLNAVQEFAYDILPTTHHHGYVAIGSGGAIVRSLDLAAPAQIIHGTTEALHGIAWSGHRRGIVSVNDPPTLYVVGDNGVFLTSDDYGLDWKKVGSGLEGNNFGIDVGASTSTLGYTAWVAGEDNRIQHLSNSRVLSPRSYFSFYPGELDFGLLTFGQSRTLRLKVQNRGKVAMTVDSVSLTGSAFSIAQGGISRLAPGDTATLYVRYKPGATSELDLGELRFVTSPGAEYGVPLQGRCLKADWQPVFLASGDSAFDGEVIDLAYTANPGFPANDFTVYALVDTPGRSRLFCSPEAGAPWSEVTLRTPPTGREFKLTGLSVQRSTNDNINIALSGGSYDTVGGALDDGIVHISSDGGSNWSVITPNDGVDLAFSDVAIYPDGGQTNYLVASSSSTTGASDVWQTQDWGLHWSRRTQPPANAFRGGKVAFVPRNLDPTGSAIVASSGSFLYARDYGSNWPYGLVGGLTDGVPAQGFGSGQEIRDMAFAGNSTAGRLSLERAWVAGDNGLFWAWERGSTGGSSPFATDARWFPAANQEVFGTTSLEAIAFEGTSAAGYAVGEAKVFHSADGGRSWNVEFDAGASASIKAVAASTGSVRGGSAWAGGSSAGKATIWTNRLRTATGEGILLVNDIEFFNDVALGGTTTNTIALRNVGSSALSLHNVRIESDDPVQRFHITGTPPTSIPAGATRDLTVALDGTPDPVDVAALDPLAFFRFENGWGDTSFADHSGKHRTVSTPSSPDQRPTISLDPDTGQRDRCLRFDGDDYATMSGVETLGAEYSLAAWVNLETPRNNQAFFGKHSSTGASNLLLAGYYFGGYYFAVNHQGFDDDSPIQTGWQHIAVTCRENAGNTDVTFYRDGTVLWQHTFTTQINSLAGRPWVLGMDWDDNRATDHLVGCLDDVGIFDHLLNPAEIRMLMNKSAPCGAHHARLVINSGSEDGERITELRGSVVETSDLIVIDTVPSGQPVTIDGAVRTTPVPVAVRGTSTAWSEWVDGSLHTLTAPDDVIVTDAAGNVINYNFSGWNLPGDHTAIVTARPGLPHLTASYAVNEVTPLVPMHGPIPDDSPEDLPGIGSIGETPRGPFLRLTGGNVTVGGLGGGGFSMDGELFVTLTRVKGSLSTTEVRIPDNGNLLAVGAGSWLLDMEAGDHFTLKTTPPSLTMLGYELAPKSAVTLAFEAGDENTYDATFELRDEFKPVPGFLEFKRGLVSVHATLVGGSPSYQFRMNGGLRAFPVPDAFNDPDGWAINTENTMSISSTSFDTFTISLGNIYAESDFFLLSGSTSMSRTAGGPLKFNLSNAAFLVNDLYLATLSGSISTDSELVLNGSLPRDNRIRLSGMDWFAVYNTSGSASDFTLRVKAPPQAAFELSVPSLTLKSSANGFPLDGLSLPGITIDSNGTFDTGKILLPSWTFDGITLNRPSAGTLAKNYIRLKRGSDGSTVFNTKAQLPFLPGCPLHDFALTISDTAVGGSFRGRFCILPEPISLRYNSGSTCQFSGSAFGWTTYFGSSCIGYRNDATGICIGTCP